MSVPLGNTDEAEQAILGAMTTGSPLPEGEAAVLLSALGPSTPLAEVLRLVRTFQPMIRGGDWLGYVTANGLSPDGLTVEEAEALELGNAGVPSVVEGDPLMAEYSRRVSEHAEWVADECPLVRRFETLVGADHEGVEAVVRAVGPPTESNGFPDLPSQLQASLPAAQVPARRHEYLEFFHAMFQAVGPAARSHPDILRLCGRELGRLFPAEPDHRMGPYGFQQARLLLEDRLGTRPDDVDTLAWLAELGRRAGDEPTTARLSERLLALAGRHPPSGLAELVRFSLGLDWCYSDPAFDLRYPTCGTFGWLEREWVDEGREPLAYALLRRGFSHGRWNADLIRAVAHVDCNCPHLPASVMPPSCWVWAAHDAGPAGSQYYRHWGKAHEAAALLGDDAVAVTAIPFLIAGALRGRHEENYVEWFDGLRRHASSPDLRLSAAKAVAGVREVADRLPTESRVALVRLEKWFATELAPEPEGSGEAAVVLRCLDGVEAQEPAARKYVGDQLWERLSERTKEYVRQFLAVYYGFEQSDGDRRDYGIAVVALSNAVLTEVDRQFSLAVRRPFFQSWGRRRSLGDCCHLLIALHERVDHLARLQVTDLSQSGLCIGALVRFLPWLENLRTSRNPAAHADKIDREEASLVYSDWFVKGRLKELFASLHPSG